MENASAEFDKHDIQLIENARRQSEADDAAALSVAQAAEQAEAGEGTAAPTPAPATAPAAAPAPAPAPAQAAAPAAAPAVAAPPKPQGDPRAALRASRVAERQARETADRVAAENAELRRRLEAAGQAVDPAKPAKPDDKTLDDLAKYEAGTVEYLRALERENAELKQRAPAAAAPAPAFTPEYLPAEVQDHVDEVPELLEWQVSPDQTMWTAAKAADQLLQVSDKWAGKPLAERFAEAVRLVKANITAAEPSPPTKQQATLADAQAAIARAANGAAPRVPTVGDLRGGATPDYQTTPDYSDMSDEEIIASLR